MRRRLLNLLTALSLLLCVAVCVLWVRSYGGSEWATYATAGGRFCLTQSCRGAIFLIWGQAGRGEEFSAGWTLFRGVNARDMTWIRPEPTYTFLGLGFASTSNAETGAASHWVSVPHPYLLGNAAPAGAAGVGPGAGPAAPEPGGPLPRVRLRPARDSG